MNKAELINAVAVSADVSKKDAEAVITATLDAITGALHRAITAITAANFFMFITPFNVCFRAFNKIVLNNFLREKNKI